MTTNPNPNFSLLQSKTFRPPSSMAVSFSYTPATTTTSFHTRLESVHSRRKTFSLAGVSPSIKTTVAGISCRRNVLSVVSFAASRDDSQPSEGEIEMEKDNAEEAGNQEAWQQVLASFKEQALQLQSVSQEAYETYSKKAGVTLKETAETLKIQADQATQDLLVLAQEMGEDSKQFLSVVAENSPEEVKDVVETFASAEDLDDVSKVRDFYVGIPYGTILSAGGFLNFMITGSVSALRFGVILGGVLLALSVSSLRAWKKGQSTNTTLKGQAAIAGILALRDIRLLFQGPTFVGLLKTVLSGSVAAFFIYRVIYGSPQNRPNIDGEVNS